MSNPHGSRDPRSLFADLDRVLKEAVRKVSDECVRQGRHLPQIHIRGGEPYKVTCKRCPSVWTVTPGDESEQGAKL